MRDVLAPQDAALEFMDRARELIKPKLESKKLVQALKAADVVHKWVACKEEEIKGLPGTSDAEMGNNLAWLIASVGNGIVFRETGNLAILVNTVVPTESPVTDGIGDVRGDPELAVQYVTTFIDIPGFAEAKEYAAKAKERRLKNEAKAATGSTEGATPPDHPGGAGGTAQPQAPG